MDQDLAATIVANKVLQFWSLHLKEEIFFKIGLFIFVFFLIDSCIQTHDLAIIWRKANDFTMDWLIPVKARRLCDGDLRDVC